MSEQLLLVISCLGLLSVVLLGIGWLKSMREHKKLKQDYDLLERQLQRIGDDLAGLCLAAKTVDSRMLECEARVNYLMDNMHSLQAAPTLPQLEEAEDDDEPIQGYGLAIEKIRHGISLETLVKECGLTRDEAVLLMRLHGKERS